MYVLDHVFAYVCSINISSTVFSFWRLTWQTAHRQSTIRATCKSSNAPPNIKKVKRTFSNLERGHSRSFLDLAAFVSRRYSRKFEGMLRRCFERLFAACLTRAKNFLKCIPELIGYFHRHDSTR